ncbi:ParB/RepB/Spo0J family partition protein [Glaciimonas sp. GG7]
MTATDKKASSGGTVSRLFARSAKAPQRVDQTVEIDLDKCVFDPKQPRKAFHAFDGIVSEADQAALVELGESIEVHGLIHPITVSELPDGRYLVRVGERRTRASMLKGAKTIEAKIRNDLDGLPAFALQLAENTDRENLTDREIADSIIFLLKKSEDNPTPMSKAEIARALRKSAGWVTRYLTFGDEIKQQKWVAPGYVESPEILYLLSVLPDEIQELIYADLSTGKLSPPLRSRNIEHYKSMAGVIKSRRDTAAPGNNTSLPSGINIPGLETDERVAMISAAMQGNDAATDLSPAPNALSIPGVVTAADSDGGYQIAQNVVESLRSPTFQAPVGVNGAVTLNNPPKVVGNTAVPCRLPVSVLGALMVEHADVLKDMASIEAEIRLPSALAVLLVKQLTGKNVEEETVGVALAQALNGLR